MEEDQSFSSKKGEMRKNTVDKMKSIDDLRAVLATLVTGTKADEVATKMSAQCHIMMGALGDFDWSTSPAGTQLDIN